MKKVYLAAYFKNNLGDDLFVYILANRYPNCQFSVYGDFRDYKNLPVNVRSAMTNIDRMATKILYKIGYRLFPEGKKDLIVNKYTTLRETMLIKESDGVVYITGSGFIEGVSSLYDLSFYKAKPYVLGCNFGPYNSHDFYEKCYESFSYAEDVCFRERYSAEKFKSLPNVRFAEDIVFNYDGPYILPEKSKEKYVVISVIDLSRKVKDSLQQVAYDTFIEKCIKKNHTEGKKTILIGFCKSEGDEFAINRITEKLDSYNVESFQYPDMTIEEAMGLIKGADSVIATRYHAVILGLMMGKKTYPIIYSDKTTHVLNDIGIHSGYIEVKDIESIDVEFFLENEGIKLNESDIAELKKSAALQFALLDKKLK